MSARVWAAAMLLVLVGVTGGIFAVQQTNISLTLLFAGMFIVGAVLGTVDAIREW